MVFSPDTTNKNIVKVCLYVSLVMTSILFGLFYIYSEVRALKYFVEGIRTTHSASTLEMVEIDKVLNIPSDFCLSEIKAKLNLQRGGWGNLTPGDLYKGAKEAFDIGLREALPAKIPMRILDIGCGFALYDNILLEFYGYAPDLHLYLLDKTTSLKDEKEKNFKVGGFRNEGISFYTNLECAANILVSNGANRNNVHILTVSEGVFSQLEPSSFDLVFSLLSYGHHYPVSKYVEKIKQILRKDGVLILDLRVIDGIIQGLKELKREGFNCKIFRHRKRGKTVRCVKM